ncbi:hypothetical protein FQA47_010151 [Oryzias melastigma]|uniref:Uncharacterized protein n=1 Tax=Oryzias melastigma TaxID=30732 RepID=A0A834FHY1_ORYME|nr:hypothetical protein FQA47_010151 [Oryzias melastigma]
MNQSFLALDSKWKRQRRGAAPVPAAEERSSSGSSSLVVLPSAQLSDPRLKRSEGARERSGGSPLTRHEEMNYTKESTRRRAREPAFSGTCVPAEQEVIEDYSTLPGPSVIYSVLDFPKRPPTVVEFDPNDTEYAHVSYTPDHRDAPHRAPCKPDSTWCQM